MSGTHEQEVKFLIKLDTERKKVLRVYLGWTMADVDRAIAQSPSITVEEVLKVFSQKEWNELSLLLASFAGPETKTRQRQQAYQKGLVTERDKSIVNLNETLATLQEQIRKDRKQIEINKKEIEEQQIKIDDQRKIVTEQSQEIGRQEKQIALQQKILNKNAIVIKQLQKGSEILIEENEQLRGIAESQNKTLVKIREIILSTIKYIPSEIKKNFRYSLNHVFIGKFMKSITRKQLKLWGCSDYLAQKLTVGVMYTKVEKERSYVCLGVVKRIDHILNNSLRLQHRTALLLESLLEQLNGSSTLNFQQLIESSEVAAVVSQIDNFNKQYPEIQKKSSQAIQIISDVVEEHRQTMLEYIDLLSPQARQEFLQSVGGSL